MSLEKYSYLPYRTYRTWEYLGTTYPTCPSYLYLSAHTTHPLLLLLFRPTLPTSPTTTRRHFSTRQQQCTPGTSCVTPASLPISTSPFTFTSSGRRRLSTSSVQSARLVGQPPGDLQPSKLSSIDVHVHVHARVPCAWFSGKLSAGSSIWCPGLAALEHRNTSRLDCPLRPLFPLGIRHGPTALLEAGLSLPENLPSLLLGPHQILFLSDFPLLRQTPGRTKITV